jgi:hypothetical protein
MAGSARFAARTRNSVSPPVGGGRGPGLRKGMTSEVRALFWRRKLKIREQSSHKAVDRVITMVWPRGVDGGLNPRLSGAVCRPGRFCQRCPCRQRDLNRAAVLTTTTPAFY